MLEIVYIHIPKTGGSSILQLFHHNFHSAEIFAVKRSLFKENPTIDPSVLLLNSISPEIKVLHGHFTFKEVSPLLMLNPNAKVITFLRNPIDRVVSNYTYFKTRIREGKVPGHQINRKNETLSAYAALPESQNRMSRFLQGISPEQLFFTGILEDFENDLKRLFESLELTVDHIPFINKNKESHTKKQSLTVEEYRHLKELNKEDIKLYEKTLEIRKNRMKI